MFYCPHCSMISESNKQLEALYPKVYRMILPKVKCYCRKLYLKYGKFYVPSRKELDRMVDEVWEEVDDEVEDLYENGNTRSNANGPIFKDLTSIMFINELSSTRRTGQFNGEFLPF